VLISLFVGALASETTVASAAAVPTCNVLRFGASSSVSTRPGGTTVRLVMTSRYFPTCDWSYGTKYQFFTSAKSAIGSPLDFRSSPTVAVPVSPWPVNDTFQVVQSITTEEGVRCTQKSAAFVGVTGPHGARILIRLPGSVGVCVSGATKWSSLQAVVFPKPTVCTASALRVSMGRANGAAGTIYYPVVFTNVSAKACQLAGVPTVQPTTGATSGALHALVGPTAAVRNESSSGYGDAVRLVPKAQASAAYGVAETGNFTPSQCVAANFKSLEVTLGGVGSWWVALAGSTCTLLASTSVTGVVPGSSGLTP
jgi:hypothetical protein